MDDVEGSSSEGEKASKRNTTGIRDRGMCIEGQLTNLGEPPVSLKINSRKMRGTGGPRALALNEPHLLGDELPKRQDTNKRQQQGIGKGAKANRPEMGRGSLSGT